MQVSIGSKLKIKGEVCVVTRVDYSKCSFVSTTTSMFYNSQVVDCKRRGAIVLESKIDNFPRGTPIELEQESITLEPLAGVERAGFILKMIYSKYNVRRVYDQPRNEGPAPHPREDEV